MASKTVIISPQGAATAAQAAGVSATCVDYDYDVQSNGWTRWYRATAPTISGYTFDHFEWNRQKYHNGTASGSPSSHTETLNPFPPAGQGKDYPDAGNLSDVYIDWGGALGIDEYVCESIVAVYTAAPTTYSITAQVRDFPGPGGIGVEVPGEVAINGGVAAHSVTVTANQGASVTLSATAFQGYAFDHWELNGASVSSSATYTFAASSNATYTAVFKEWVTITTVASPQGGGTTSPTTWANVPGTNVTIRATAANGYRFDHWQSSRGQTSTAATYSFNAWYTETWTAYFVADFTITVEVHNARGGTVSDGTNTGTSFTANVASGQTYTLTATPLPGFRFRIFRRKVGSSEYSSTNNPYSFLVTSNQSVVVFFCTDLLVNSYDRSTPVQLVYDPTTNLLVADY